MTLVISALPRDDSPIEMVERKGLGHPDSICDALTETLSRNLCRHYLDRFGVILHHNVDKALLCGGSATPRFGGGEVLRPMEIHLAGRATTAVPGQEALPLDDIVIEGSRAWLREHLHALDVHRHVRLHNAVQPGSKALTELFQRSPSRNATSPLANDTSIGVGYAPLSSLEHLVLKAETLLNSRMRSQQHPAWGEDIKIMGVREHDRVRITVACAMIDRHLSSPGEYLSETAAIRQAVQDLAAGHGFHGAEVRVNAADDPSSASFYLTVTGTSAEAGDDGEVGRGNRANGLITPYRPMSLEATAGKNPVSHVGKIYNVVAQRIADEIVSTIPEAASAQCFLVSEIGEPVDRPAITHVRLSTSDGSPGKAYETRIGDIVARELTSIPALVDRFVAGTLNLF
jgi:S-adenosylmethionine synthetase